MTKEEVAAMFSGKPVAPETPPEGKVEREVHGYVMDKDTTKKLAKAVFQDDAQAAFADTIGLFGKINKGDIEPKVCESFTHAVLLAKYLSPQNMMILHQGICFTREGYVVATIEVGPRGISLGLMQKSLHPFEGGFSEEKVILLAKETVKDFEEATNKSKIDLFLKQSPEDVATAILAAIESLPKED